MLLILELVHFFVMHTDSSNCKNLIFLFSSPFFYYFVFLLFFSCFIPFSLFILDSCQSRTVVTACCCLASSNRFVCWKPFSLLYVILFFASVYWQCGRIYEKRKEFSRSLKSTHTTLLDDFHRYSDCVADGGKQLRSRHHTKQMTRSPERSRSWHEVAVVYSAYVFLHLVYRMVVSLALSRSLSHSLAPSTVDVFVWCHRPMCLNHVSAGWLDECMCMSERVNL